MNSMRMRWGVPVVLVGLGFVPMAVQAQLPPSPDAPPVSTAPAQAPEEESVATFS